MHAIKNHSIGSFFHSDNCIILFAVLWPLFASPGHAQPGTENGPAPAGQKALDPSTASVSEASQVAGAQLNPSSAKAFLLSLVLPGAGEFYAGSKKSGLIFLSAEIALWSGCGAFRTYGDWKKEDYRLYAAGHAGVDLSAKDHAYFVDIENYSDLQDFNDAKLRQRDLRGMYPEDGAYSWSWDSDESRMRFKSLRLSSDRAYNRSFIVIGVIVVNHIISGIDAVRVAKKKETPDVQVGLRGFGRNGIGIAFVKRF
jgi:hypothetical protein